MTTAALRDASKLWPYWPMAHAVTRERDRRWPGVGSSWRWLCSDIERDRPARVAHTRTDAEETA